MKVAVYCRVGNSSQLGLDELDRQEEYLKKYCRENGHEVACVLKKQIGGIGQPGPELQRAMKMILEKEVEGIAVKDFSRDTYGFLRFQKLLRENDAKLIDSRYGVMDFTRGAFPENERKRR